METYEIYLKDVPMGIVDADIQRVAQVYCDCRHAPPTSMADAYRQGWLCLGEGSPAQAALMMKAMSGMDIATRLTGAYTKSLVESGHLEKVHRGWYRWIGNPTSNTIER